MKGSGDERGPELTSYANRPPRTLVLQCDRIIRKGNQTIKAMSQLTDRN